MQAWPDAGLGPVPWTTPGCDPRATYLLTRYITPGCTRAQDEEDACQGGPVVCPASSRMLIPPLRRGWQNRSDAGPQIVGHEISDHVEIVAEEARPAGLFTSELA
ncbi:hypothetical protein GCM10010264_18280 [Streptomyces globisporus]|nr:hypothetical protein GCM10010264_18280 [Streptomyces globisporus]